MSNNTYTAKETSFWKFIQENEIEIPIIQRDYAQGRLGKESLRKNFLSDLKKALDNEKPYKDKAMKMDFVYGSVEHEKMNPLDGQQRLTTLWLLHWYIALLAGKLNDEIARILNRFSYETRISSREFCGNMCNPEHFKEFDGIDIVGFITRQTWFYSAWKQDPTIQSMLRMLGGTKVTDKKGEDIIDGLEELFACPQNCKIQEGEKCVIYRKFNEYWSKLTGDNCPIVFYHLPLKDFGLSDDLYIKMNARGKQLTSFENFKADLVDYITEQSESELLDDEKKGKWKSLLDERDGIPIKMDTVWTDIFWKNRSCDKKIDEIYFAFLNRFFFNELVCAKDTEKKGYLFAADSIDGNASFNLLYGDKSDDSNIKYEDIEIYRFYDKKIPINIFKSIRNVLNNSSPNNEVIIGCFPEWVDKKFSFIPTYQNGTITTLGQKERVVFLAVCRYFEKGGFNKTSFRQWMRIVWNIVENAGIETIPAMIGAMRLIDKLSEHAQDIYHFLASEKHKDIGSTAAKDQMDEEIAKAKQILDENGELRKCEGIHKKEDGSIQTWEDIIIKAEQFAFFKGTIRFLFQDGNGEVDVDPIAGTWNTNHFDTKWMNAQMYFDENGVKKEYQAQSILLRTFISKFKNWDDFWGFNYDNEISTWRYLLTSKRYFPLNEILSNLIQLENDFASYSASLEDFDKEYKQLQESVQNDLVKTNIVEAFSSVKNAKLNWRYDKYCLYPKNTKSQKNVCIIADKRNIILSELLINNTIECNQIINKCDFFWGWDINFKYNNYCFQWWRKSNDTELDVYLMKENGEYCKRKVHTSDKNTNEDKYFCFRVTEEMGAGDFLKKLDCLIQQACAEKAGKDCFNDCPNEMKNHLS